MVVFRAAVASMFILLGACSVGEVPIGGGGTPDGGVSMAAQKFASDVKPLLTRCDGCHSTGQPPNFTSFATLTDRYKTKPSATNVLLTKAAVDGPHQGILYFNATERQAVAMWIDNNL